MGYRYYIAVHEKNFYEKYKGMKIIEKDEDYIQGLHDTFIDDLKNSKEEYCFGKYIDFADDIYENSERFFDEVETSKEFSDYGIIKIEKRDFLKIINNYMDSTKCEYTKVAKAIKNENVEEMKKFIKNRIKFFGVDAVYNTSENSKSICNSWLYEHEIFEMLRIYKTIKEDDVLIFYGS